MKAEHRHELQTNELADWLEKPVEKTKPYAGPSSADSWPLRLSLPFIVYVRRAGQRAAAAASEQLITR